MLADSKTIAYAKRDQATRAGSMPLAMLAVPPGVHHEEQEHDEPKDKENNRGRLALPKQLQSPEVHKDNLQQENSRTREPHYWTTGPPDKRRTQHQRGGYDRCARYIVTS